jgi:hypothetical protein
MELQELVVRVVIAQLRFRLAPRFADIRGALIDELLETHGLSEYGWDETHVRAFNEDRTRNLVVASRELLLEYEHIERLDDLVATGRDFLEHALAELRVETIDFLGVRTYWMAAVDSFDELASWVRDLAPNEPFSAATSQKLTDVGYIFEYRERNPRYALRMGPMKIEQALEQYLFTEKRELFPDVFLWLDIDRTLVEADLSVSDAPSALEDAIRQNLAVGERIAARLGNVSEISR